MKKRYWLKGFYTGLLVIGLISLWIIASTLFSYDGMCGGFMFLAGPSPCSFWEYVSRTLPFIFLIMVRAYWLSISAILGVPVLIGYLLDRRVSANHRYRQDGR